jgi:hypothetical protein
VLPRSVCFEKGGQMQWTRSRNKPCSQTPAGLVCEAGLRMWPRWQESRPIYPRSQCAWQKCSDAAFAKPFLLILTARRAHFPPKEHAFPSWFRFWSFRTVHNPTVVIPFSHSVDGVSSPVRDHGGLARVPLRTHPSVLPRSVHSNRMDGHHAHARETGSVVGQMHPIWTLSGPGSDGDGRRVAPLAPGANVRGKSAAMRPSRSPFCSF